MTTVQTELYNRFDDLPGRYRRLCDQCAESSFDQTIDWFDTLSSSILGEGDELKLIGLSTSDASGAIALAPLVLERRGRAPFEKRTLHALSNYYTAHYAPIVASGLDETEVAKQLCPVLLDWRWQTLDLNPIDASRELCRALADELISNGAYVQVYFRFGNWFLELEGRNFDEYFGSLPSRLRNTLTRKERKLTREVRAEIEIHDSGEGLTRALADYRSIYDQSWKQTEPFPDFISDVSLRFAERGWLRLGLVTVDGKPAAAQIWFVKDGTASIFKLAYDPQFGNYSVGSILTKHLMQHVIDKDHVHRVDYLCGDDSYKQDWMSQRRVRSGIRAYRLNTVTGALGATRSRMSELLGRSARKISAP